MKTAKFFTLQFLAVFAAVNFMTSGTATAQTTSFKVVKNSGAATNPAACATNGNYAVINWSTSTEQDVNCYIIERSVNHGGFKQAAIVFAAPGATGNSYTFTDRGATVNSNEVCYRISTVYNDGTVKQYDAAVVSFNAGTARLAK